ncbi:Csu type fimbrial protein [Winslowiella iniecta]|uniref:Fimbrial protein n=1 Tax=Winslowiella iniecta TaxID=1560201 RepID=A0A0L7T416_9GAMM|nr:spore coat U domain-containing protein [Winslowiella iniecta]KOC90137.1 fimbrial protein [Winslowiella iniecta]KOC94133.1 fimbrial protein [Winslowiella iniecta]
MKTLFSAFIALIALGFSTGGWAACTLPASTASFGTASSFTVNSTVSTTTSEAQVNCGSGSILSLLGTNSVTLRLASASAVAVGNSRGTMKRAGDVGPDNIPVMLCSTSNCTPEMTIGATAVTYNSTQLGNLVGLLGGLNFTFPLYLRTVPGQTVAAGTYTVTLNIAVTYRICTGINIGGICVALSDQNGSGTIPLTVTMVVTNDCTTINSTNISFGSAPLVSSFSPVSQSVSVYCTKGSTYTVGISNGAHAVGNVRNMASGSNLLAYEIYKGSTTDRWGPAGAERWTSTASSGVSTDGVTRTYLYTAKVLPTQNTPAAGSYTDTVVVDLTF